MPERSDLRKVFMVLGSGIAAALLITSFFISNYGPNGQYNLNRVLLAPDVLKQLNYNDWNPKTSEQDRFVFDRIEFVSNGKSIPINLPTYEKIYQLINGDKSVSNGGDSTQANRLTIYVKTESPSAWQVAVKVLQEVQFGISDYRVQLHEDNKGEHFAYFQHPDILKQVKAIIHHE